MIERAPTAGSEGLLEFELLIPRELLLLIRWALLLRPRDLPQSIGLPDLPQGIGA